MIRLGSLAGYPFEGPRLLGGWTPPQAAAVYAIMYKPEPAAKPENYAVIYVGHAEDLSAERFPFKHPRAACWISRAGSKWKVYVCTYEVPGGTSAHREQIARELIAVYRPSCNEQQYDHAWKDEWIGEYSAAPTTAPVTRRGPDQRPKNLSPYLERKRLTLHSPAASLPLAAVRSATRSRPRRAAGSGGCRRRAGPARGRRARAPAA
jgi:hypothetical protein